jgi:hypothetical protein
MYKMDDLVLTEKECTEIITNCVVVGQRKGSYSIKDASIIYKVLGFLKTEKPPKDLPELDKKISFDTLIKAIVLANSKGSYTIEEAALIDKTVSELQRLELASVPVPAPELEESDTDKGKGPL